MVKLYFSVLWKKTKRKRWVNSTFQLSERRQKEKEESSSSSLKEDKKKRWVNASVWATRHCLHAYMCFNQSMFNSYQCMENEGSLTSRCPTRLFLADRLRTLSSANVACSRKCWPRRLTRALLCLKISRQRKTKSCSSVSNSRTRGEMMCFLHSPWSTVCLCLWACKRVVVYVVVLQQLTTWRKT